jgi:hypothetical protein
MVLAGLIGTIVLLAVLIVSLKRTPAPLVGWLFFFAAIFPSMGVIGFTVVVASDKFAYLPSVGLLVPLAGLLAWMQDRWKTLTAKMVARASVVVVVAVLAAAEIALTRKTCANWADTYVLNRHMLAMAPNSAWVHNCSAVNFIRHMQIDQAVEHLEKALRIDPAYAEAHNSIGVALDMQGKSELAIEHFTEAIKCRPNYPAARRNLALALARKGQSGGPPKN